MGKQEPKGALLPGTLEMLILRALERNRDPMHGYGIALFIKSVSNDVLKVEEGSLYPALQRLSLKGWVKAEWGQSENNRRARFYRLTTAGRKHLQLEMEDFERVMDGIFRLMRPARGEG
ncbi:MAG: PadR family transcriptional regulator [Vicinamibacteria bacterium]